MKRNLLERLSAEIDPNIEDQISDSVQRFDGEIREVEIGFDPVELDPALIFRFSVESQVSGEETLDEIERSISDFFNISTNRVTADIHGAFGSIRILIK